MARKKTQRFTKPMQKKLFVIFALVLFALVLLNINIAYINIKDGDKYTQQVLWQQQTNYNSRYIPYRRGEIRDRNGNVLAKSEKAYNVILDHYLVNSDSSYIEPTIRAMVQFFGLKESDVRSWITDSDYLDLRYDIVKRGISEEDKEAFDAYLDTTQPLSDEQKEEREKVKGVFFEKCYVRAYPLDSVACTVVGWASDTTQDGVTGLEKYYSDVLNGVDGREYGYLDSDSQAQLNIIEPENGNSIVTTLDINIQQVVEKYIAELEKENKNGPQEKTKGRASLHTGVIVANPNNGEILAMATDNVYDPNNPEDLTVRYKKRDIKKMTDEEYSENLNALWNNFCVSQAFELGSTYKPNVVASALDSGSIDTSFGVKCTGSYQPLANEDPIACTGIHGDESVKDVIANSCNPGMMNIAKAMGIDTFIKYQGMFGFGRMTGIDLPGEDSGVVYDEKTMADMELATCSFGQGFTATMVQELQAFCADVNGGYLYKPHVVKQILNSEGEVIKNINPILMSQPISNKTSSLIKEYLEAVVTDGTAKEAQIAGYKIGGKTGTAEKIPRGNNKYIISYICAVPIDDPQVVIYTVIDEPNIDNQEQGIYTKTLAKNILQEILPYLGIYPTEDISEYERNSLGIQVETEAPKYEEVVEYIYDDYGYYVYDEETGEPMTEIKKVLIEEETEEEASNRYGNILPPEERDDEDEEADENEADKMSVQELHIGL